MANPIQREKIKAGGVMAGGMPRDMMDEMPVDGPIKKRSDQELRGMKSRNPMKRKTSRSRGA